MHPLRALIVDDESLARDTIRLLAEEMPELEVVAESENGLQAIEHIQTHNPDLVFLDIQMPDKNGFEVLAEVGAANMPDVIFVTAYDQYALRAFEAHAIDYLLKPFDDNRFRTAVQRATALIRQRQANDLPNKLAALLGNETVAHFLPKPEYTTRLMVKNRDTIYFVEADDINSIEAAGDYVTLHADGKRHLIRETMTRMEQQLNPKHFIRIHRSTIVNLSYVAELKPYFHGDYIVYMKDGRELKLSRRYWRTLEGRLSG